MKPISFRHIKGEGVIKKLEYLEDNIPGAYLRLSLRNVPHLIVSVNGTSYSIAYFRSNGVYRIFYPYPCEAQTRVDKKTPEEVLKYFREVTK